MNPIARTSVVLGAVAMGALHSGGFSEQFLDRADATPKTQG